MGLDFSKVGVLDNGRCCILNASLADWKWKTQTGSLVNH